MSDVWRERTREEMKEAKHSHSGLPFVLPLRVVLRAHQGFVHGVAVVDAKDTVVAVCGKSELPVAREAAAFIVRACNAFEPMRKALQAVEHAFAVGEASDGFGSAMEEAAALVGKALALAGDKAELYAPPVRCPYCGDTPCTFLTRMCPGVKDD